MLALEGVGYTWPGGQTVLHDVNLDVRAGQRIVLAGVSGCGKSTLLRLLSGLISPTEGSITSVNDSPLRIGFVRQQPENQLVAGTVFDEVALGLEYQGLESSTIEDKVHEALERTGLAGLEERSPAKLSGGQMQRLAFAAAWALDPDLWLLDEPTSYLDPGGKEQLYQLLANLPEQSALLWVASDPEEYALTGTLALMHTGTIISLGKPEKLFAEGVLVGAGLLPPRSWRLRNRLISRTPPQRAGEPSDLPESARERASSVHSPRETSARLCAKKVHASRREFLGPQREILRGIDLILEPGEITAVVGPTGAGKSTLIEVLAGLLPVTSGQIDLGGQPPGKMHGRIGVAFQFPERGFFAETVLEEVAYGARNLGLGKKEANEKAHDALVSLGLDDRNGLFSRSPFELSGGEARRVALASVYVLSPVAWLLDEPTAGLDNANAEAVGRMIRLERDRGCPVLIAGHDLDRFADWTDRWLLLHEGRIERSGYPLVWWQEREDPWPPPATVRAWRETGQPLDQMPGIRWEDMAGLLADHS